MFSSSIILKYQECHLHRKTFVLEHFIASIKQPLILLQINLGQIRLVVLILPGVTLLALKVRLVVFFVYRWRHFESLGAILVESADYFRCLQRNSCVNLLMYYLQFECIMICGSIGSEIKNWCLVVAMGSKNQPRWRWLQTIITITILVYGIKWKCEKVIQKFTTP